MYPSLCPLPVICVTQNAVQLGTAFHVAHMTCCNIRMSMSLCAESSDWKLLERSDLAKMFPRTFGINVDSVLKVKFTRPHI